MLNLTQDERLALQRVVEVARELEGLALEETPYSRSLASKYAALVALTAAPLAEKLKGGCNATER